MPISITCAHCGKKLKAPDNAAGKRGRCPNCKAIFEVPEPEAAPQDELMAAMISESAAARPAEPDVEEEAPSFRPPPARADAMGRRMDFTHPGWRTVQRGLRTMYIGIVVVVLGGIALVFLGAFSSVAAQAGDPLRPAMAAFKLALLLPAIAVLGAVVAMLVGQCMCCAVPAESGARGLAVAALAGTAVYIVCSVAATFAPPVRIVGGLANLAASVTSILFLRAAALSLRDRALASSATKLLVMLAAGLLAATGFVVIERTEENKTLFMVLGVAFFVWALVFLAWYLGVLRRLANTIADRTSASRRAWR